MEPPPQQNALHPATHDWCAKNVSFLLVLATLAFLVMGYHPGLEDDAFYLAAIKHDLNPALFPHDADFFRLQFQATIFDKLIALSIRLTHLPIVWAILLWQFAATFLLLRECWRIARRCFASPEAQWSAVSLVAGLLTLPIGGIAISLADQYLHPRTLAAAATLAAVVAILDRRHGLAVALLTLAFAIHAIMASFGISFCLFLYWKLRPHPAKRNAPLPLAAFLFPLGWLFEPASDAWRKAAGTRGFYFLSRWHWYEWLGVFAPLILIYFYRQFLKSRARTNEDQRLLSLLSALLYYGIFQTIIGLIVMLPASLERLRPFEPMRFLHVLYVLFFLIAGGLLGSYVLGRRMYRWTMLFLPLSAGMFYAQMAMYPASPHFEFPFVKSNSGWLQAFSWIRQNTPRDALFAIDPHYELLPGEDYHGFRALAERSVLADYEKDAGMAARVPGLAPRWLREVTALNGWQNLRAPDFERLRNDMGVTWVVLSREDAQYSAQPNPMTCPYENAEVKVCRLY